MRLCGGGQPIQRWPIGHQVGGGGDTGTPIGSQYYHASQPHGRGYAWAPATSQGQKYGPIHHCGCQRGLWTGLSSRPKKKVRNANRNEPSRGRSLLHSQNMAKIQDHRSSIEQWLAVAGGCWVGGGGRLAVGGWWRLAVGGGRRLAVGGWRLVVPRGCPERAVLNKQKKRS